ncbi:hypothetical protein BST61_g8862 [Cercospora zeina]
MPFAFALPTTSSVLLSDCFDSLTHPALPLTATTKRSIVKDALKKHKRLAPPAREAHLPAVQRAINDYLPFLLALNAATGFRHHGPERLDVDIKRPLHVEWRSTLSAALPGREHARPKLTGLHHEIAFTLSTLAYTHALLARSQLRALHASTAWTTEQRTTAIATAMKHLVDAHAIHTHLLSLPAVAAAQDAPVDVQPATISALASLALAEATMIVIAKDDPYIAAVSDGRNENNKDWMFKAPTIPKVRAHLYARFCLAAAEHATAAGGLLGRGSGAAKLDQDLVKYVDQVRRTARGRAARFLAIDAELSGKTGEGLAWLKGARKELGLVVELEDGKRKGFKGLKQSWQERREDRKVDKGAEWGMDAGRLEEARVVEMLEAKWDKENSTINVQLVPPYEPLLAQMPSGREYHTPQPYQPPTLDTDVLAQMRAPPEPDEKAFRGDEEDSGDEAVYGQGTEPFFASFSQFSRPGKQSFTLLLHWPPGKMGASDGIRALLEPLLSIPLFNHIDGLELSTLSRVSASRIAKSALPYIGRIELVASDAFRDDYSPLYLANFDGHELEPPTAIICRLEDEFAGRRRGVSPYRMVGIRDHHGVAIGAAHFSIFLLRAQDVVVPYLQYIYVRPQNRGQMMSEVLHTFVLAVSEADARSRGWALPHLPFTLCESQPGFGKQEKVDRAMIHSRSGSRALLLRRRGDGKVLSAHVQPGLAPEDPPTTLIWLLRACPRGGHARGDHARCDDRLGKAVIAAFYRSLRDEGFPERNIALAERMVEARCQDSTTRQTGLISRVAVVTRAQSSGWWFQHETLLAADGGVS